MEKDIRKNNCSEEDYLESILLIGEETPFVHRIEVAKRMGVSQAAVNKAMRLLVEKEYVYEDGKHLYLTEKGNAYACSVYDKHRTIRAFLSAIGVSSDAAEIDACKLEHLVGDETFAMMKKFIGK